MKDEAEWAACQEPQRMLEWLEGPCRTGGDAVPQGARLISDRKLRLYACAVHRHDWQCFTDERSRDAVITAEAHADGLADDEALRQASWKASLAFREATKISEGAEVRPGFSGDCGCAPGARQAARWAVAALASNEEKQAYAALLREIVGNPFHRVGLPRACVECGCTEYEPEVEYAACARCAGDMTACPWITPPVLAVARAAYDDRDFALLPLVADALVDAGCDDEDLLRHLRGWGRCPECLGAGTVNLGLADAVCGACCGGVLVDEVSHRRGPGWVPLRAPHVRGCWAADLLLGKS